jgi:hypothetical protein
MSTPTTSKPATPASAGPDAKPETETGNAPNDLASQDEPKKRYTKGTRKFLQKGEVVFSRSAHRFASALEEGLDTWRKKRNESALKKKDGALKDVVKNSGKAFTKFSKLIAEIPEDLTKGLPKIKLFR